MTEPAIDPEPRPTSPPAPALRRLIGLLRLRMRTQKLWKRSELQVTLLWAGVVGFLGALSSLAFRSAADVLHYWMTSQATSDYVSSFYNLPLWQRVAVPTVGGLLAGGVLYWGPRLTHQKKSTTDYMEAIAVGSGWVSFRGSLVKSFSALFSVASGESIGREGPMVQLAAMLASIVGRLQKFPRPRLQLMVACGGAAGIASAYNAPIAGAMFVAEIVLGSIAMESFGPLVLSSVVAALTLRRLRSGGPLYLTTPFALDSTFDLGACLLLGIAAGIAAPWFLRFLRASEKLFTLVRIPTYLRLALGGLVVGALAAFHPEVCGNGYSMVQGILQGEYLWPSLIVLLAFKVLATGATFGSGAVGGVFTPTLFVGASLGFLYSALVGRFVPVSSLAASGFALVGMGAFLTATTHAPLMAILLLFEMTLDYEIVPPLMIASVAAFFVSRGLGTQSIYSEALRRKAVTAPTTPFSETHVGALIKPNPVTVSERAGFTEIGQTFLSHRFESLYVVDSSGGFVGVISLHDIKEVLNRPEMAELIIARDIVRLDYPTLSPERTLLEALEVFSRLDQDEERLPVIDSSGSPRLLGTLSKTDLLLTTHK